jgi:hypothetical protein
MSGDSVVIVAKSRHGQDLVLTVEAPASTHVGIGRDMESPVPCASTVLSAGDVVWYRVLCPPAPPRSQLMATISNGAFDYTFPKRL